MAEIIIDHLGLSVGDLPRARAFYDAALAPLGMVAMMEFPIANGEKTVGYGNGKPIFWISGGAKTTPHTHIAFQVGTRAEVDAFHAAALAAGGIDNGGPGVRAMYHPTYYGAFVLDPEGHNIEAVCHQP